MDGPTPDVWRRVWCSGVTDETTSGLRGGTARRDDGETPTRQGGWLRRRVAGRRLWRTIRGRDERTHRRLLATAAGLVDADRDGIDGGGCCARLVSGARLPRPGRPGHVTGTGFALLPIAREPRGSGADERGARVTAPAQLRSAGGGARRCAAQADAPGGRNAGGAQSLLPPHGDGRGERRVPGPGRCRARRPGARDRLR